MFRTLLVPLDRSALAEQAVGTAASIARSCHGAISLILAHRLAPYDGSLDSSTWEDARDPEEAIYVRSMAEEVARGAGVTVSGATETGRPVEVICRRAHEIDADLIVMTTHGRTGISRAWLGSVADGVVREAAVPVLMLRPTEYRSGRVHDGRMFHRILVPLDGSTTSSAILDAAVAMATCSGGVLVLARVVTPIPLFVFDAGLPAYPTTIVDPEMTRQVEERAREDLTELAQRLEAESGLRVETVVRIADHPAGAISDIAKSENADLIAMTTHGRGASRLIMGSTTDKVLRGSALPLLLLHPHAVAPSRAPIPAFHGAVPALTPA